MPVDDAFLGSPCNATSSTAVGNEHLPVASHGESADHVVCGADNEITLGVNQCLRDATKSCVSKRGPCEGAITNLVLLGISFVPDLTSGKRWIVRGPIRCRVSTKLNDCSHGYSLDIHGGVLAIRINVKSDPGG